MYEIGYFSPTRIAEVGPYDHMIESAENFDRRYAIESRIPDNSPDTVNDWFG